VLQSQHPRRFPAECFSRSLHLQPPSFIYSLLVCLLPLLQYFLHGWRELQVNQAWRQGKCRCWCSRWGGCVCSRRDGSWLKTSIRNIWASIISSRSSSAASAVGAKPGAAPLSSSSSGSDSSPLESESDSPAPTNALATDTSRGICRRHNVLRRFLHVLLILNS